MKRLVYENKNRSERFTFINIMSKVLNMIYSMTSIPTNWKLDQLRLQVDK